MHPLQRYLDGIKADQSKPGDFGRQRKVLADQVGVSPLAFHNLTNPNQRRQLAAIKALRLDLATGGAVPAESVRAECAELLVLAERILRSRRKGWLLRKLRSLFKGGN